MTTDDQVTPRQLAHNDQVLADVHARIDGLIAIHRSVLADGDLHPQVALAGFAAQLELHDPATLAKLLAVAIDRLTQHQERP